MRFQKYFIGLDITPLQIFDVNPAAGIIVSANQNPFPSDYAYPVAGNFAAPYRANQIRDVGATARARE